MAAMRSAWATGLTTLCARPGNGLPPLIRVPGATPQPGAEVLRGREGREARTDLRGDYQSGVDADGRDRGEIDTHHLVQRLSHRLLVRSDRLGAALGGVRRRGGGGPGVRSLVRSAAACGIIRRCQAVDLRRDPCLAVLDLRIRRGVEHDRGADLHRHDRLQRHHLLIEHRLDLDVGQPQLACQMALPDRIASELLAHEHLQQQLADGFERGIRTR